MLSTMMMLMIAHQGGWVRRLIGHLLLRPPSFFQTTNISSLFSQKDAKVMHFFSKQRLSTESMKKGHTVFPDILFAQNTEICFTIFHFFRDRVHICPGVPPLWGFPHPRLPQRHLLPLHLLHRRGRPREQWLCRQQQGM